MPACHVTTAVMDSAHIMSMAPSLCRHALISNADVIVHLNRQHTYAMPACNLIHAVMVLSDVTSMPTSLCQHATCLLLSCLHLMEKTASNWHTYRAESQLKWLEFRRVHSFAGSVDRNSLGIASLTKAHQSLKQYLDQPGQVDSPPCINRN